MSRVQRRRRRDPIEQAMELALRLGDFIDYGTSWTFVSGLEEVERDIEKLLSAEPARAVDLYETFIAGCYEKAEYSNPAASQTRPSPGSSAASSSRRKFLWVEGRATSWRT